MATNKPVIGITPSPMEDTKPHGTFQRYAIATGYTEAVEQAGGVPIVLPPQSNNVDALLSIVDGLLISGGGDIHPNRYREATVHPATAGIHHARDELELNLVQAALERDMPILCICRGIQVLNVALGGTLIQDVADQYSTTIQHRQQENGIVKEEPGHTVSVIPDTRLAEIYGTDMVAVNSFHHQGLQDLAEPLRINAIAEDGLVEAVDLPTASWVLGVQWHPEMMFQVHAEHHKPFQGLVDAARTRSPAVLA